MKHLVAYLFVGISLSFVVGCPEKNPAPDSAASKNAAQAGSSAVPPKAAAPPPAAGGW